MKCCCCGKVLDTSKNEIPASWYGKYKGGELTAVICPECLKSGQNEHKWMERT